MVTVHQIKRAKGPLKQLRIIEKDIELFKIMAAEMANAPQDAPLTELTLIGYGKKVPVKKKALTYAWGEDIGGVQTLMVPGIGEFIPKPKPEDEEEAVFERLAFDHKISPSTTLRILAICLKDLQAERKTILSNLRKLGIKP